MSEEKSGRVVKKPQIALIAIAAAVVAVILFAFIWEAVYRADSSSGRSTADDSSRRANYPPLARSPIQDELNDLDTVIQEFLPVNEYSRPGTQIEKVNGIVIHYIGNPDTTAMQNRNYFANLSITKETHASSNFIICLDGAIVQCVPVDEIAYASNARNADTISIELCHPDETGNFTDATYESAIYLTAWLCIRFGLNADDIIRHYDVTGKQCPKLFVEDEDAWEAFKADVMNAVELVSDVDEERPHDPFYRR